MGASNAPFPGDRVRGPSARSRAGGEQPDGAVTRTCMDSNFSVFGTSARWVCADEVGAYAEDGDSGAPVFYHDSWLPADKVVPIGLLFAKWTSPYAPYETYFYLTRRELIESVLGTTLEF